MNARPNGAAPIRSCVGCSSRDAQSALLRLRLHAGSGIVVAALGSGRSAYVHERPDCVAALSRSKGLGRSLRSQVGAETRRELVLALQRRLTGAAPA